MKFIDNYVEEYVQEPGVEGAYRAAMVAAAVCYQTDTEKMKLAPKDFCEQVLMAKGHGRPMEFGTVYLKVEIPSTKTIDVYKYNANKYTKVEQIYDAQTEKIMMYITTNLRVLMQGDYTTDKEAWENGYDKNWFDDLKYWCEPTEYHFKRRTFSMYMSRGCTDDNRTHVELSSVCESTRFCNYSKGKFGGEMTFIWPYWIDIANMDDFNNGKGKLYEDYKAMRIVGCTYDRNKPDATALVKYAIDEETYLDMVDSNKLGLQPQQGKRYFPLGAKAELRLCGFDDAWRNFFWRRCDDHADPECQKTAEMIKSLYFAN